MLCYVILYYIILYCIMFSSAASKSEEAAEHRQTSHRQDLTTLVNVFISRGRRRSKQDTPRGVPSGDRDKRSGHLSLGALLCFIITSMFVLITITIAIIISIIVITTVIIIIIIIISSSSRRRTLPALRLASPSPRSGRSCLASSRPVNSYTYM